MFVLTIFIYLLVPPHFYSCEAVIVPMPSKDHVSKSLEAEHVPGYMMNLYKIVSMNFIRLPLGADVIRSFSTAEYKKTGQMLDVAFHVRIPNTETVLYIMFQMCIKTTKTSLLPFGIELNDLTTGRTTLRQMTDYGKEHCVKVPVGNKYKMHRRENQKTDLIFGIRLFSRFNTTQEKEIHKEIKQSVQPLVIVFSKNIHAHRVHKVKLNLPSVPVPFEKRSVNYLIENRSKCRRESLIVNFAGLGYKGIIAPTIFDAKQCLGVCKFPLGKLSNPTQHSMIQQLLHSLYGKRVAVSTCCAAKQLAPLTIMINDTLAGGIAIRSLEDMVVAECGCI